jgi:hypothetical protein
MVSWLRRPARLWMICGLFAILFSSGEAEGWRAVDGREWRAIDEFGCAIAPLVLFALIWLLVDSAPPPNAEAGTSA